MFVSAKHIIQMSLLNRQQKESVSSVSLTSIWYLYDIHGMVAKTNTHI